MILKVENEKEVLSEAVEQNVNEEHQTKQPKKMKPKEEIVKLQEEILELKEKLLRNQAEVENFKKRVTLEKINDRKYASKKFDCRFFTTT